MIDQTFRNICRDRGLRLRYTKAKERGYRSTLLIKHEESNEKAEFGILLAFSEMDVSCYTDTSSATIAFKEGILFVLDYIAQKTHSETLSMSINEDDVFLFQNGFIKKGTLPQFSAWKDTFPHAFLNSEIPVRIYGEHPLEQRIRIWSGICQKLNEINEESKYVMNQGLGHISIHWIDEKCSNKFLEIRSDETGFFINHKLENLDISSEDELFTFMCKYASEI